MTPVEKVAPRGLVAAAIMLPLILVFCSLADAQPRIVNIACGQDIDATINADPHGTASRFVLGADCPFTASATIVPSNGDEVACALPPTFVQRGPAFDPTTRCTVAGAPGVENVFKPIGQGGATATVRFEGITITGGNFTGSSGTGAGIAEGSMTDSSSHFGIEVRDNEAAGILSAKGTFERVELTNNSRDPNALGFIGAGMKVRNEVEVKESYIHDTQGNGLWCDEGCVDASNMLNGFWVHDNLVVNNGGAGIRWEGVGVSTEGFAGEALIENNEVHGNSRDANRGGISVRDAQNATIQNNRFGRVTIAGVSYGPNSGGIAIIASDSGRGGRPNLFNIDILNNTLNGETIKGCELPDEVVDCMASQARPEGGQARPEGVAPAKTITGTDEPNTLIGTTRADQIGALRGGDYIDGMQGDDALHGNQGNDKVLGRGGKDRIAGGLHSDALLGGSANDTIKAADGYEDSVDCGTGANDTAYIDVTLDTSENCENVNPPHSTGRL